MTFGRSQANWVCLSSNRGCHGLHFSGARPKPEIQAVPAPDEEVDRFFPPHSASKDSVTKGSVNRQPQPVSGLTRMFASVGIYLKRPKMGEMQLAKLVNKLTDAVDKGTLEILSMGITKNGLGPCLIRLAGTEYLFQSKPYHRFTFQGSSPIGAFNRYSIVSQDGQASLTLSYLTEKPSWAWKLVYKNRAKGIKLVSREDYLLNSAKSMLDNLALKVKQSTRQVLDERPNLKDVEDLEL